MEEHLRWPLNFLVHLLLNSIKRVHRHIWFWISCKSESFWSWVVFFSERAWDRVRGHVKFTPVPHVKLWRNTTFFLEDELDLCCRANSGKQRASKNPCIISCFGYRHPDLHILVSVRLFLLLVGDWDKKRPYIKRFCSATPKVTPTFLKKQQSCNLISPQQICKELDFARKFKSTSSVEKVSTQLL